MTRAVVRHRPGLGGKAVFILAFGNGGAVAPVLNSDFNRVVLQWKGTAGLSFTPASGADYGEAGHVWSGAPRDMTAAVLGEGSYMTRNATLRLLSR